MNALCCKKTLPWPKKLKDLFPKLGCKLRPTIKNDIFRKTMISKNMILKNNLAIPLPIIVLVHIMK
jgi:hypothetical protein